LTTLALTLLIVVAIAVAAVAWYRSTPFDRERAVDRAVAASGGRLTRAQARCYVDTVRARMGTGALTASPPSAAVSARLTAIRDDCIGLAVLATPTTGAPTATAVPGTEAGDLPLRHGQDAALDQLWTSCGAGYGQACDDLFDRSPVGSQYEAFALSCGGRTQEPRCAAVYRSPGVTLAPPVAAQVPTTS